MDGNVKKRALALLENASKGEILNTLFARLTDESAAVFARQVMKAELRRAYKQYCEAETVSDRIRQMEQDGTEAPLGDVIDAQKQMKSAAARIQRAKNALMAAEQLR